MKICVFYLSYKDYLTVHRVLLANYYLQSLVAQDIRSMGHVFDHVSVLHFRKEPKKYGTMFFKFLAKIKT